MSQGTSRVSGRPTGWTGGSGAGWLERQFHLAEFGTDLRTELIGGLTTFMVMSYIIAVNPLILNKGGSGLDIRQVATVTCLVAGIMSIAMGLYANRAIALAPGLGINAIVAFTLTGSMGLTFPQAMGVIVAEGVVITILVLLGIRQVVLDAVPLALKQAISVGIGFFILFIGLHNAGIVAFSAAEPTLASLNTWPIFVAIVGLAVTLLLMVRNVRGSLLWGILLATAIAFIVPGNVTSWPSTPLAGPDFSLIGQVSFNFFGKLGVLTAILVIFSLMLADFFDTMGTLIGVGARAGYLDPDGGLPQAEKPLLIDSLAAVAGGLTSASSATSYIESIAGVEAGGRTGLVSVVVGILFLLALPFVAVVAAIPGVATAPALIIVGCLMVGVLAQSVGRHGATDTLRGIAWDDLEEAVPVTLTMLLMPFTFNITNGIGAGFVAWVFMKAARGKAAQVHPALWVVAIAFLIYFLRWALFGAEF